MDYYEIELEGFTSYQELKELWRLLRSYQENDKTIIFGDLARAGFNANSGMVFLIDENYHTAVVDTDENGKDALVDFVTCPECGNEGELEDMIPYIQSTCCLEYLYSVGDHNLNYQLVENFITDKVKLYKDDDGIYNFESRGELVNIKNYEYDTHEVSSIIDFLADFGIENLEDRSKQ